MTREGCVLSPLHGDGANGPAYISVGIIGLRRNGRHIQAIPSTLPGWAAGKTPCAARRARRGVETKKGPIRPADPRAVA